MSETTRSTADTDKVQKDPADNLKLRRQEAGSAQPMEPAWIGKLLDIAREAGDLTEIAEGRKEKAVEANRDGQDY